MEEIWLVDVAVPVPLRQTFTYKIPSNLSPDSVCAGHRVLVPFRAKLLHGVTMTDAYPGDDQTSSKTRFLVKYDADQRILAPEIQKLSQWLTRYYRGAVGEVIKMALPPGLLSEKDIIYRLTPEGETHIQRDEDARVLAVLAGKSLGKKDWEVKAQAKIKTTQIRDWEDAGYLQITTKGGERETIPHLTVVQITEQGLAADPETLNRAPKQKALLIWFRERPGDYVTYPELNELFKNGTTLAGQLVKRGLCRKLRVPKHEVERRQSPFEPEEVKVLTQEQEAALEEITAAQGTGSFQAFLLYGVTGGGKTEVYLRAIQNCLEKGRQALFLVPEIGLTPMMQRRIIDRFGERLAILHSAVGAGRRAESWARVLAGKVDVVLGARSGLFAPLPRLGLVIVDEEHDQSYKQNDGVRYHGRDLALVRAQMADAIVVLGSATPSLESWRNHLRGRFKMLTISKRATRARLPAVEIVDLREEFKTARGRPILSRMLDAKMEHQLDKGHQVMILLNRRGYHSFLMCRKCGENVMCSQCEVSLTYHSDKTLKCHYCGETRPVPKTCPSCASEVAMMQFFGEGTQQIQEILEKRFPDFKVDRLDRDRLSKKDAHQQILADFEQNRTQILVGTQMIAKGHDFPNVTLVGIVNADIGLRVPDFRNAELVFQLITQVAGRSGRGDNPGSVVIQTYMPEHYSIVTAAKHDYGAFLEKELRYREHLFYSPFAYMVAILITHQDHERANQASFWMAAQFQHFSEKAGLVVLGPAKAPIGRIKNAWRYQIVLKSADRAALHQLADAVVEEAVKQGRLPRQAIIMDIDPYQFF